MIQRVKAYLLTASFRVHFLLNLVIMSAFVIPALWLPVSDDTADPGSRLISAVIIIVVWTWLRTTYDMDRRDRLLETTGLEDQPSRWAALEAAVGGPVPEDPRITEAAHRIALERQAEGRRVRTTRLAAVAFLAATLCGLAFFSSLWWAGYAILAVVAGVLIIRRGKRWERRAELLGRAQGQSVPSGEVGADLPGRVQQ